jgi:hypothetical protein
MFRNFQSWAWLLETLPQYLMPREVESPAASPSIFSPLPDGIGDFSVLDRCTVVVMHCEADGTQVSRELYEGDVAPFVEYQRIAVTESVPLLEYVRE